MSQNEERLTYRSSEELRRMVLASSWERDRVIAKKTLRQRNLFFLLAVLLFIAIVFFNLYFLKLKHVADVPEEQVEMVEKDTPPPASVEPPLSLRITGDIHNPIPQQLPE